MNWTIRWLIIVVIGAGIVWLWLDKGEPSAPTTAQDTQTRPEPVPTVPPQATEPPTAASQLPDPDDASAAPDPAQQTPSLLANTALIPPPETLANSDAEFLALVGSLNEEMPALLTAEDQLRKWVLFVHLAAAGKTAQQHWPFKVPVRKFQVLERGDRLFLDPANYARYTPLVDALTGIPAQTLASYFRFWQPLLENAYQEIGEPGEFDARVALAIEQILSAPALSGDIELEQPTSVMYRFKNPDQEKASAIHKWLWRVGPDNAAKLQAYFREVAGYLGVVMAN